uniref:Uncharacterized protein n=1 Tax=Acanthochromis polyacanthus TaxID=80966 RepID=A0A3Q1F3T3_9TELE
MKPSSCRESTAFWDVAASLLIISKNRRRERLGNVLLWSPLSSCTVLPKQNGRAAIVTGGTRGMGFETAKHLASLGMHVIIGRLLSNQHCKSDTVEDTEFVFVDLTSLKSVRQFAQTFIDRGLPLHVLVNNGRLHQRHGVRVFLELEDIWASKFLKI